MFLMVKFIIVDSSVDGVGEVIFIFEEVVFLFRKEDFNSKNEIGFLGVV